MGLNLLFPLTHLRMALLLPLASPVHLSDLITLTTSDRTTELLISNQSATPHTTKLRTRNTSGSRGRGGNRRT